MVESTPPSQCSALQLEEAAHAIRQGKLVVFPTETVYGLGANALDAHAVANVFQVKARPHFDPLIVHVTDIASARKLVATWPNAAMKLAAMFWPGPLTLVLPRATPAPGARGWDAGVADLVTAGLDTIALRVPGHALARSLIRLAGVPLAAPSANRFGRVSPTCIEHVHDELDEADPDIVHGLLDGGPCEMGVESTVLAIRDDYAPPLLLRPGSLPVEAIEELLGHVIIPDEESDEADHAQLSPGRLKRHYAPATPLTLLDQLPESPEPASAALVYRRQPHPERFVACEVLSPSGSLVDAAANLFAAIRRLDAAGAQRILAERLPDEGLGRAINDRLKRAGGGR